MPFREGKLASELQLDWSTMGEAIIVDEADANTIYAGGAIAGSSETDPVWKIKKITVSGTITKTTWADGNLLYDNVWADRASLTYL